MGWVGWGELGPGRLGEGRAREGHGGSAALAPPCQPLLRQLGLGASFWVVPPVVSLLIKYALKVRLSVVVMSHL